MPHVTHASLAGGSSTASLAITEREMRAVGLFKDADIESLKPLLQVCPIRALKTGEIVVRAGDSCPALYLVLSGCLRAQDPSTSVPDTLINAGDSLGELFLLQDAVVAWTISAVEPTRLLVIDSHAAWKLIDVSHVIARNLLGVLGERLRVGGAIGLNAELRTSYKRHATLDESTGLHNRNWLESVLPRQMARSSMSNTPLALLLVEIDEFADYKEQFGPEAGDHARYAVAQTLINNVRPTDMVACYGPAQFAIVLPEADLAGACVAAERVRDAVTEAVVLMSDESILPSITISIGATVLKFGNEALAFLKAAEAALHEAQAAGGNRCMADAT